MRKADNLPPSCAVVTKSVNLNFLEPSGPLWACNGTDLSLALPLPVVRTRLSATLYIGTLPVLLHSSDVFFRFRQRLAVFRFAVSCPQKLSAFCDCLSLKSSLLAETRLQLFVSNKAHECLQLAGSEICVWLSVSYIYARKSKH